MQKYTVNVETQPRLDIFISSKLPSLSRSSVQKLAKQGKVFVNGIQERASHKLKIEDKVAVDYDPSEDITIPEINLPIIYEDDDVIVVNKPVGVLTHSKGNFNPESTVATFIHSMVPDLDGDRSGVVHRLDRATSGVIVTAKGDKAQDFLQNEFATRRAEKVYIAIVEGHLKEKAAIIDMPIERNPKKPATFRVGPNGKKAITEYKVINSSGNSDVVMLMPKTGRTHQLRVHLQKIGHPIVGDILYKGSPASRMYLHSNKLKIRLPGGKISEFVAELPEEFNKYIKDHE